MTIEKAIRELIKTYEKAQTLEWVDDPVAWALYQVWKDADSDRQKKAEKRPD